MSFSFITRSMILTILLVGSAASLAVEEPDFTPLEARLYDHLIENLDDFVTSMFDQDASSPKEAALTFQDKKDHLLEWFSVRTLGHTPDAVARKIAELDLLASAGLESPADVRQFALKYLHQDILAWRDSSKPVWVTEDQRMLLVQADSIEAETIYRAEIDQWIYRRFIGYMGLSAAGLSRSQDVDRARDLVAMAVAWFFTREIMAGNSQFLIKQFEELGADFFKLRFTANTPVEFAANLFIVHTLDPSVFEIYAETVDHARDQVQPMTWAKIHDRIHFAQTGKQRYWTINWCEAGELVVDPHEGEDVARAFWDENHPGGFDAWLAQRQCSA